MTLPSLRLKPKADARAIRFGAPWAYTDDLVLDRRSKAIAPGSLAILEDSAREPLAIVTVNTGSKIGARILEHDMSATVDADWIAAKLRLAAQMRDTLYPDPFYRLIHAEGDGLPGVIIDRFDDVAVIQPNTVWADQNLDAFVAGLGALGITNVIMNGLGRARKLEGLPEDRRVIAGFAPLAPIQVPMNGALYMADLMEGQKTGLFFDQRDNHGFVARLAKGARVLDVFSHVGGFGLACAAHGAADVTCVDGSQAALDLAQAGAAAMGQDIAVQKGDAFDVMSRMQEDAVQFDLVICDPPAFAPSKQALERGLRAYERTARLAADLVAPGGYLVLCSCSHAADLTKFTASSQRGIGRAGRRAQRIYTGHAGPDHPQHPALKENAYLKAVAYRLIG